ncbi:MAG: AsmA-like C-terminal region-containing protein [Saprospiraceae bacterium]|nr:hypothetical protein [Lewinella sp.]
MKIVKRILIGIFVLIVLIVGAAILLPIIFKDDLIALTKQEINKNVRAKVDFETLDLSLLRSFPDLNLSLQNFTVDGIDQFEGIPLANGKELSFGLDLMSVIKGSGTIGINSIHLEEPNVNILVLADGSANYDIAVPTDERIEETASETDYSGMVIQLDEYSITKGTFIYDDRSADTYVLADNINHSGSGNFTLDEFDLDTETDIAGLTVSQAGIPYLKAAHTTLDAIFNIKQTESLYTLKDNALKVNDLLLNADGSIQMKDDDILLDLTFNSPQNNFKDLFSLIPNAYIAGYEDVQVDGAFVLNGEVKGTFNSEREEYPSFKILLDVANGRVKYPDLPMSIDDIFAKAEIESPSSDFDQLKVDVPRFSLQLGDNPFRGNFSLRNPISDPAVKAGAEGTIDLADLIKAYPMEGIDVLAGVIKADMSLDTRYSYMEKEQYDRINMSGDLSMRDFRYETEGLPPTSIKSAVAKFTPQKVVISELDAQLGKSDFRASGNINNILAYFSPDKTMSGDVILRSNTFDANEWISEEETDATTNAVNEAETSESYEVFDRFDFNIDAQVGSILYDEYELTNTKAVGRMMPNRLEAQSFSTIIEDSDMAGTGTITNMFDYVFNEGILGGEITVKSKLFNLNSFMSEDESTAAASTADETGSYELMLIPKNIKMTILTEVDRVLYTNLTLNNVVGKLYLGDGNAVLEDATARGLGGDIGLSGSYNTEDEAHPTFALKYNLNKLNFTETFKTFNSYAALAPIGKFITGDLSSSLILEGELGQDMMPKLETINAQGFLETINSFLADFKPFKAVGNALNIQELTDKIQLDDIKTWFTIENGVVAVKPFDVNIKGIAMTISGSHGLNQSMDYRIQAKIPREMLERSGIGQAAGNALDKLTSEANKLGLNIAKSEFVNVGINLGGTMTDPSVKYQLLEGDGSQSLSDAAKATVQQEIDEQKEKLEQQIQEKKDAAEAMVQSKVDAAVDSVKIAAEKGLNKAKDQAIGTIKDQVKDTTAQKFLDDLLKKDTTKTTDQIKDQLEKFNPFKKKKKNN